MHSGAGAVAWRVNRGEQVVALNLIFTGDASPDKLGAPKELWFPSALYTQQLASIGERPIGLEAAQLVAIVQWFRERTGAPQARLEAVGIRSQVTALIAAALEPTFFVELLVREGMRSLRYLLDTPVKHQDAPDLSCLDLYKEFDVHSLAALAAPTKVVQRYRETKPA